MEVWELVKSDRHTNAQSWELRHKACTTVVFTHFKTIFETCPACYLHRVVPLNTLTFHYPGQKNAARTKQARYRVHSESYRTVTSVRLMWFGI